MTTARQAKMDRIDFFIFFYTLLSYLNLLTSESLIYL
jgi:hypothetical protein